MVYCKSSESIWRYILVVVISIPHINGSTKNYIKMFPKIGENITLKCSNNLSIHNIKNSDVQWTMKHKELPGRVKIMKNGDLFITSFDSSDAGIYTCDLAAANGYVDHIPLIEFELKPRTVPEPLLDVEVIPYSVLMLITWKELIYNGGSPIQNITISYRAKDNTVSNNNWKVISVDPFKVQKEIYSLSPNTLYEIQIWASNELGNGKKTELTMRTKSEMTENELEKRLLEGIDTFDTRAWTFAVIVIMSTFSIFGIALCCLFVNDSKVQKSLTDSDDIERIELIPNITINPGYCET